MKKRLFTTLLLSGIAAGFFIALQFQTKVPISGTFPTDEVQARSDLVKEYSDEQSYLQSRIVSLRKEIEDVQASVDTYSQTANFDILNFLKGEVGLTEIRGSGVEIVLGDAPSAKRETANVSDSDLIQASDLRDVVNLLNASSVSAISINNQRVIASSPIVSVGTTVLVNNSHVAPPFVISAVGDRDVILQRFGNKELLPSIYERALKAKLTFGINLKDFITIPVFNGNIQTHYANLVK